ncbi:uncharacterized protein TNCV_1123181 [Trichonephila clavipes]|uniref:Uncharacterized protein n=1 Tax=Trichonephila clavipes TaxID=2585209 RepID=A0A8X6SG49_TRICX|nr:uncharacterized protein TNCV_1123181 [Trichonephila clavipes]
MEPPAHFSGDVRNYLDVTFGQQWIGRGGPFMTPPVNNAEELVARIAVAAGEIRNSPGVFQNVWMSMRRRFMSRRKQLSAFDQVSEFDRGRLVAYRDCRLSFREIGSCVGRNQTTKMRICDRWMQEGTAD